MSGWQCPDLDKCDFDLCEMCIRWILHCQKHNLPLGIKTPEKPDLFGSCIYEHEDEEGPDAD
jgi:hypothetical protein